MEPSSGSESATREHEALTALPPISVLEEVPSPPTPQVVTVDDFLRQSGNQLPKNTYRKSKRKFVNLLAGPGQPTIRTSGDAESPEMIVKASRKRRRIAKDSPKPLLARRSVHASEGSSNGRCDARSPSPPSSPTTRQAATSMRRDKPPLPNESSRKCRKYTAIPLVRPMPSSSRIAPPRKAKTINSPNDTRRLESNASDPTFVPPLAFVPLEESLSGYAEFRRRLEGINPSM